MGAFCLSVCLSSSFLWMLMMCCHYFFIHLVKFISYFSNHPVLDKQLRVGECGLRIVVLCMHDCIAGIEMNIFNSHSFIFHYCPVYIVSVCAFSALTVGYVAGRAFSL